MVRVGISGWQYKPWRSVFYPKGLRQKQELSFASRQLNSIEINGSFYSLKNPRFYNFCFEQTPDDFLFSIKGSRYITHMKRLKDCELPLANFFASGVLELRNKLGPILWQLPPNFKWEIDRIDGFLSLLPKTIGEAYELALQHDERIRLDPELPSGLKKATRLRHALEVRNASFENKEFVHVLRQHQVCLVFSDSPNRWPYFEDVTADFVYLRLHGEEELYSSGYTDRAIKGWVDKIQTWQDGREPKKRQVIDTQTRVAHKRRDAYVYFDNDAKVYAPFNAMQTLTRLTQYQPQDFNQPFSRPA